MIGKILLIIGLVQAIVACLDAVLLFLPEGKSFALMLCGILTVSVGIGIEMTMIKWSN